MRSLALTRDALGSIRWRLTISYALVVLAAAATLSIAAAAFALTRQTNQVGNAGAAELLAKNAATAAAVWTGGTPSPEALRYLVVLPTLQDLHARTSEVAAVGVLARSGHLIVSDSCTRAGYLSSTPRSCQAAAASLLGPVLRDPTARSKLQTTLGGGISSGSVASHSFAAVPISPGGGTVEATLVASFAGPAPTSQQPPLLTRLADQWQAILPSDWLWLIALTVMFGTAAGALLSHRLVRRLEGIAAVAARWSRGDLAPTADASRRDELGRLAADLNEMAGQIRSLLATRSEVAAQEERRRLQRDLHDGIKQELFAASMQLATAEAALAGEDGELSATIARAAAACRRAQQELAALLDDSSAPPERLPLEVAVEQLGRQIEQASRVRVTADLTSDLGLDDTAAEALYRVAQEALANIRRHADASNVTVRLARTNTRAQLEIQDDGHGFDSSSATKGMGLTTMRERVEALGGEFSLESKPGGTRVIAVLPVAEP